MRPKTDSELGRNVQRHLKSLGLEPLGEDPSRDNAANALQVGIASFLSWMGLGNSDPSIKDTPKRVAEMFAFELCAGLDYTNFPKCTTTPNGETRLDREQLALKRQDYLAAPWNADKNLPSDVAATYERMCTSIVGRIDEMVRVDTINTVSLCEHHFQTIHGVTHIGYIPAKKVLGLSKFARVTDFYARRPQIQERMTEQLYAALSFILDTPDIAVQQICTHNCMRARGAMDPHSKTTTSKMGGKFRDNPALRQEFLHGLGI